MDRIDDLEAFLAVVEKGSLTAAARAERRSLQSISRSLTALEGRLGIELVHRTTRQSNPTEAGLAFYRRVKPALAEIQAAKIDAIHRRNEVSGVLRVSSSVLFAPIYLVPALAAFMDRHPKIEVELALSERYVDLVEEGFDVAIRMGEMADSDLRARRLGSLRAVVYGAPRYFAKHGKPKHPRELAHHQCVIRTVDRHAHQWRFRIGGKATTVKVEGRFRVDGSAAAHAAVVHGLGLGFGPLWQVRTLVDAGALELVLVDYELPTIPIHAVSPASQTPPAKTRLFTEFLAAQLKRERW
ncbi:LysR family transcriptional regulator [Pendulispora rubella]|uniref:LysR family transcriptional regulator n=1 Tax=Pendulispora rubella TaxID=2741070 RepID=A0ABZ2KQ23_9BACT